MNSFQGRNALVTGGSSGIGLAIAQTLVRAGMNIAIAARSPATLDEACEQLRQAGTRVVAIPTDVRQRVQLENLVRTTERELGSIDVLVNNAGIETYRDFDQLSSDEIEETIAVNLTAAIQLSRLVIPGMLTRRRGHIVNLSSTAGKYGPAFGAAYGASKAGLLSLAQSLRAEYRGTGVTASAICPGFTHAGGMYESMKQETGKQTPWFMGSTTADAVSNAVLRCIKQDKPEIIVNWPPLRPAFAIAAFAPRLGGFLIRIGSYRFLKRVAKSRVTPHRRVA